MILLINRAVISKCMLNAMVILLWMVMDFLASVKAIDLARPPIVRRIMNNETLSRYTFILYVLKCECNECKFCFLSIVVNHNDLVDWLKWYHDILNKSPALEQPPNNFNVTEWAGEHCERYCQTNTRPRICYYHWVLEHYHAMGP